MDSGCRPPGPRTARNGGVLLSGGDGATLFEKLMAAEVAVHPGEWKRLPLATQEGIDHPEGRTAAPTGQGAGRRLSRG